MMSWFLKRKHENIDKETMKLGTQWLFQNNILENKPSNREKAYVFWENVPKNFTDRKHQNDPSKNAFRISLKVALGVHQTRQNKINLSLKNKTYILNWQLSFFYRITTCFKKPTVKQKHTGKSWGTKNIPEGKKLKNNFKLTERLQQRKIGGKIIKKKSFDLK